MMLTRIRKLQTSDTIVVHSSRFVAFAAKNRLPAVYDGREFALDGGLMSYTPNHLDLYRRAAMYVDKRVLNPLTFP